MEGALSLYSVGKDYGTTGTRAVSVGLIGGTVVPLDKGGRPIAVAPSHCFTYRKVRLPQANARAQRRIVQEELTFGLPLPLHQCVWDYYLQSGPEAFAVVAQAARWQSLTAQWGLISAADPEPLCYLRAATYMQISDALLIDFGASHTTFAVIAGGKLDWVRTMMRGGQAITQKLADELRIPFNEAEDVKRRRGTDQKEVTAFLSEVLEDAQLPRPLPYRRVLLCGGGSSLIGLRVFLHGALGVEPEPFPMPPLLSATEHVSALGAALSGRFGQQRLHLVGSAAPSEGGQGSVNAWLGVAAACLVLWVTGVEIRYQGLLRQKNTLARQFIQQAGMLGIKLPETLKTPGQAEKWLDEEQKFRRYVRSHSVGFVADEISKTAQGLREVGECQLYSIIYDDGKLTLEGDAPSNLKAQQLGQKWKQVFPDNQAFKITPGTAGRFRFKFEGGLPRS